MSLLKNKKDRKNCKFSKLNKQILFNTIKRCLGKRGLDKETVQFNDVLYLKYKDIST